MRKRLECNSRHEVFDVRYRDFSGQPIGSRREHELLGPKDDGGPPTSSPRRTIPFSDRHKTRARIRSRPIVELHDLGVHFEPVADLVLGREDGEFSGNGI